MKRFLMWVCIILAGACILGVFASGAGLFGDKPSSTTSATTIDPDATFKANVSPSEPTFAYESVDFTKDAYGSFSGSMFSNVNAKGELNYYVFCVKQDLSVGNYFRIHVGTESDIFTDYTYETTAASGIANYSYVDGDFDPNHSFAEYNISSDLGVQDVRVFLKDTQSPSLKNVSDHDTYTYSGNSQYPYALEIDSLEADKAYGVYFQFADGEEKVLPVSCGDMYYLAEDNDSGVFYAKDGKLKFYLSSYDCVVRVYEVDIVADFSDPEAEDGPGVGDNVQTEPPSEYEPGIDENPAVPGGEETPGAEENPSEPGTDESSGPSTPSIDPGSDEGPSASS